MTKKRNEALSKSEALIETWKKRSDYKGYDKSKGGSFNSWRAIIYTQKGNDIGYPESWRDYKTFLSEVQGEWSVGMVARRIDQRKPHSKENTFWSLKGSENCGRLITLVYDGQEKTLIEWCSEYNLPYNGVRQRYYKGKNLSAKEILFGKERKIRCKKERSEEHRIRRMFGAYKLSDRRKGRENNITLDYFKEQSAKKCVYCGEIGRLGLDRIDNSKGHVLGNVVPCCYDCNSSRMNKFTHEEMFVIGNAISQIKRNRNENRQESTV